MTSEQLVVAWRGLDEGPPADDGYVAPVTQDEADAIHSFDLSGIICILTHWTKSPRGAQALLQPVHGAGDGSDRYH